jgi:hypothetical protein
MGDLDANILADAARRFTGLRRRYWRFILGFMALVGGPTLFGPLLNPDIGRVLKVLVFVGLLTCWVGGAVTLYDLMGFRCPRCGKRFIVGSSSTWPTDRCKHCQQLLSSKAGVWDHEFDDIP